MVIPISNPRDGGKRYTSEKNAKRFVRMGIATMTDDGSLFFYERTRIVEARILENEQRLLDQYRAAGVVFWNGDDLQPSAMHRPGEAVS